MGGVLKKAKRVLLVLIVLAIMLAGLSVAQVSGAVFIPGADLEEIYIQNNYLDITEGSETMDLIQEFIDNGVYVQYMPQREQATGTASLTLKVEGLGVTLPQAGLHIYETGTEINFTATPSEV